MVGVERAGVSVLVIPLVNDNTDHPEVCVLREGQQAGIETSMNPFISEASERTLTIDDF